MATVAVDVDDTLYSFTDAARDRLADLAFDSGDEALTHCAYSDWPEWSTPPRLIGVDAWLEIIDYTHQDDEILSREPFRGSVETVEAIAEEHDVVYLSSRREKCYPATYEWLFEKCGFPVGPLTCTSHDKSEALKHCQYIIDDRSFTLVRFVYDYDWKNTHGSRNEEKARKAFSLLTQHNRALSDVPGIYLAPTWAGIRHYLEREGVIS